MLIFKSRLPKPNSQLQEVLYDLLLRRDTNHLRLTAEYGILNPTARISDLRLKYGLSIQSINLKTTNKFKREINYCLWRLHDKKAAKKKYLELNKK